MVSVRHNGVERINWIGLSTETKPTDTPDGSTYHEVDTNTCYIMYGGTWYEYSPQWGVFL